MIVAVSCRSVDTDMLTREEEERRLTEFVVKFVMLTLFLSVDSQELRTSLRAVFVVLQLHQSASLDVDRWEEILDFFG